jgi:hypothetical protein
MSKRRGPVKRREPAWDKGLSKLSRLIVLMFCSQAEEWYENLHESKALSKVSALNSNVDPDWMTALRRNRRLGWGCLVSLLATTHGENEVFDARVSYMTTVKILKRPKLIGRLINPAAQEPTGRSFEEQLDWDTESVPRDTIMHLGVGIEYIITVWHTSLMMYRKTPVELRREARCGSLDSLEDLLRIDKLAIHDKGITRQITRYRIEGNSSAIDRIERALSGKVITRKRDSRAAMKAMLGGLAIAMAAGVGEKVTPIQIKRAYDMLAKPVRGGFRGDRDLARQSYNTFRDHVREESKRWDRMLTGKK